MSGRIGLLLGMVWLVRVCSGCSCVKPVGACDQSWKEGDVIFFGRVVSISHPEGSRPDEPAPQIVHFAVSDSFHGDVDMSREVIVHTGSGAGDCGYPFAVGVRYLVYGARMEDGYGTSICSETAPEVQVGGALKELRALRDQGRMDDLFGTVTMTPRGNGWPDLVESKPLGGLEVTAVGKKGKRFPTRTDEAGGYGFQVLPRDLYRLEVKWPEGVVRRQIYQKALRYGADLRKTDGQGTGCRLDSLGSPDGRISGRVVEAGRGTPAKGFLALSYLDGAGSSKRSTSGGQGYTVTDGHFEFQGVFPGRVVLEFRPMSKMQPMGKPVFWPNENEGLELTLGQHLDHVELVVGR